MKELTDRERVIYWENTAKECERKAEYYQDALVKAHALLGRVVHQLSERWDTARLTKYYPIDNLHNKRTAGNVEGK